jgi:hypothetical protein
MGVVQDYLASRGKRFAAVRVRLQGCRLVLTEQDQAIVEDRQLLDLSRSMLFLS